MNARGSTEVIVATIGLSMGALSENLFTMIVAMAVATTMAMPPMLRWALARVPMRKAEKERLEREEFAGRQVVLRRHRRSGAGEIAGLDPVLSRPSREAACGGSRSCGAAHAERASGRRGAARLSRRGSKR